MRLCRQVVLSTTFGALPLAAAPLGAVPVAALALAAVSLGATHAGAQTATGTVVGRVVHGGTRAPIAGARVSLVGDSAIATITRDDGAFTLARVPAGARRIRVARLGFTAQEQAVTVGAGGSATAEVTLTPTALALSEVVVIGYGTTRREDLTGSVGSVDATQLLQTTVNTLEQGLQGRVAGVQVTQGDAAPGGGMRVQIRGVNSMNAGSAQPLYVIDGVPVASSDASKRTLGARSEENLTSLTETNPLAQLSPADIESIDILKDASATAIYGSRGANGVVLITTRRGRSRGGSATFAFSQGVATVPKTIDMLNAYEYATYVNRSYTNLGPASDSNRVYGGPRRPGSLTPDSIRALVGDGMNWQDEIFRAAPVQDAQLSFGGTDDQGSYMVSGNLLNQQGVIRGSQFRRGGVRMNLDRSVVSPNFRLSSNLAITRSVNDMVRSSTINGYQAMGIVRQAIQYTPFIIPDSTRRDPRAEDPATLAVMGSNPLRYTDEVQEDDRVTRGLGGLRGVLTLGRGFALDLNLGGNYERRTYGNYFPRTVAEGRGNDGVATQSGSEFGDLLGESLVRYNLEGRGAHRVDAIGGFSYNYARSSWNAQEVRTFPDDILGNTVLQNGTNVWAPQSGLSTWKLVSWIGRVNYALADRYLLTATVRADGSSKFASNNKWSTFPAVAAAWNVGREAFLRDRGAISDLKLRASYGRSGNQAIGAYQSLPAVSGTGTTVIFGGNQVPAYAITQLGNPDLRWETTDQYDVGLDLGAWENRLTASVDVYHKDTRDLLQRVTLPGSTGFTGAWINSGNITNRGVEVQVAADVVRPASPNGLRWNVSANASRNRNRVESLGAVEQQFADRLGAGGGLEVRPFIQKPGLALGTMWGYRTAGLVRDAADSAAYAEVLGSAAYVGDLKYVDVDGDGSITPADQTVIGDANPDWVGGLTNTISWRRFDFSALVTAVRGNQIINAQRIVYYRLNGQGENMPREFVRNAFHPTENPNGRYPIIRNDRQGDGRFSDVYVEDGSYVRLKNVQLGYRVSLPRAQSARVYVNAINLLTRTDYSGFDPEVSAFGSPAMSGVDQGNYPQSRIVTIGVSTTF